MSIDQDNEVFDKLAEGVESGMAHLGSGIAWAGFWIGLGFALATGAVKLL